MITIKRDNIFDTTMQCIVNPVNTDGVMGAGLALVFKKKFPDMYKTYKNLCQQGKINIGKPQLFIDYKTKTYILNFPTTKHWWNPSKLEYIDEGLRYFSSHYKTYKINSIAFPALGCGKGGLKWEDVYEVMMNNLKQLPIKIEIYMPQNN